MLHIESTVFFLFFFREYYFLPLLIEYCAQYFRKPVDLVRVFFLFFLIFFREGNCSVAPFFSCAPFCRTWLIDESSVDDARKSWCLCVCCCPRVRVPPTYSRDDLGHRPLFRHWPLSNSTLTRVCLRLSSGGGDAAVTARRPSILSPRTLRYKYFLENFHSNV